MPMRNVEWNQRHSGGPAELSLMDRYGRRGAAVGVGVLCGRCGVRVQPAWRLRAGAVGLLGVTASSGQAAQGGGAGGGAD